MKKYLIPAAIIAAVVGGICACTKISINNDVAALYRAKYIDKDSALFVELHTYADDCVIEAYNEYVEEIEQMKAIEINNTSIAIEAWKK